jgi:hypothetical protein
MKLHLLAAIALLSSTCSLNALAQERWESKGCGVTETMVIDKAGDSLITHGITRGNAESTVLGRSSYECRGVSNVSKEGVEFSSRCVFSDAEGNKIFVASTGSPKGWQSKFVGGAGKWEGISGTGQGQPDGAYGRVSPSVAGSCYRASGTYTLRKP